MEMVEVKSSRIAEVGWEDEVLTVAFVGGGVYRYPGVSQSKYRALLDATSLGKYLDAQIIGVHEHERVDS